MHYLQKNISLMFLSTSKASETHKMILIFVLGLKLYRVLLNKVKRIQCTTLRTERNMSVLFSETLLTITSKASETEDDSKFCIGFRVSLFAVTTSGFQ